MSLEVVFPVNTNLSELKFAVICARYKDKWIFCRHRQRDTWEIPGGHIEKGETPLGAAKRELFEETGAVKFRIEDICTYGVKRGEDISYGQLFFADVIELSQIPESEIACIEFFEDIPENLTYPLIQPYLYKRVREHMQGMV